MVIKVQGGRIRVDDSEPRVIKIGGVGPQGPVGVVNATAPVTYNSTTKTVGITTGTANGVAPLDANSLVPKANLPSVAINDTFVVNSQAAMLALAAQTGDVAIRTDLNKNFILATDSPSTLADWKELLTPPDAVTSVNGYTGVVTLAASDITDALDANNNLGELTNQATARTNLGLGTSATLNTGTAALTVAAGDDSRFTDSRNPRFNNLDWSTNANLSLNSTVTRSTIVRQTATLTASRTVTLPPLSTVPTGCEIIVQAGSSVTTTNTVVIATTGTDQLNGSSSNTVAIGQAWGWRRVVHNGAQWVIDDGLMRRSQNLSDVASASSARTNLGLGSLATLSTITSSDITDGTIVNADVSASAAIADSKLNLTTTVSGSAISASNKIVDNSSHTNTYEQPGSILLYPWAQGGTTGGVVMNSDNARGTLFTATRNFTVTKIVFDVASAATNDDPVQVGIFDAVGNGTLLASSTSAARGVNSAGPKTVTLSSSLALTPGTKYYVCIAVDYTSGTGFTLRSASQPGLAQAYGNTYGTTMSLNIGGVTTLSTGMWSTSTYTSGIIPFFILLNS